LKVAKTKDFLASPSAQPDEGFNSITFDPMNRILIFLLLGTIASSCGAETMDCVVESYPNGQAKEILTYSIQAGDSLILRQRSFYENGQLKMAGDFDVRGSRDGLWLYYYQDGKLWSESEYDHGKRHGKSIVYYDNGQVRFKGMYDQNQMLKETFVYYKRSGEEMSPTDLTQP
jgi:antitoxin component YwqK of YwqJK toxin-antitoxin module